MQMSNARVSFMMFMIPLRLIMILFLCHINFHKGCNKYLKYVLKKYINFIYKNKYFCACCCIILGYL